MSPPAEARRVAIIGTGIAGLVVAHRLAPHHELTMFEAGDHIGGHTHTHAVERDGRTWAVDTGFIVFNDRTYPNFIALLDELGVPAQPSSMSFSVRCDRTNFEYNGTTLRSLFVQKRNLVRPRFLGMLRDIMRFHARAEADREGLDDDETVVAWVRRNRLGRAFLEDYLIPLGAAVWSCPPGMFGSFPVRFVLDFMHNHGMLTVNDRPQWRVVRGGSARYVDAITAPFRDRIHIRTPVRSIDRSPDVVRVRTEGAEADFDHVVLACHADQALALLADATPAEREVLGAFPYQPNEAVLHTDARALPKRRGAWASWNYRRGPNHDPRNPVGVTYNMNILQSLETGPEPFCVTLNPGSTLAEDRVIKRLEYHHPGYGPDRSRAQARHGELIGPNRTSFCGAYWGYGFHEDGVRSGLAVARAFGRA